MYEHCKRKGNSVSEWGEMVDSAKSCGRPLISKIRDRGCIPWCKVDVVDGQVIGTENRIEEDLAAREGWQMLG